MKIVNSVRPLMILSGLLIICYGIYYTATISNIFSVAAYPFLQLNRSFFHTVREKTTLPSPADTQSLKRQNQLLQMQNVRLRAALAYMDKVKDLDAFNERYQKKGHIAQVLARNLSDEAHYFLVDAGAQKGVTKDMVVLHQNNLIGKVTEVYPWYSKICLITDRTCKVAAYCTQSKAQGIHEGRNDEHNSSLNFVSHLAEVRDGDLVLSSGEGLIFPEGFAVGRVASCSTDGLYKHIAVTPGCDLREIDYCVIVAKQ